jgi:hydrogenase expression/formation protein HypC
MCVGLPMQIVEPRGRWAAASFGAETREIDMALIGEQPAGAWVLVFLDAAREVISPEQARKTHDALKAVALVMEGETSIDHLFADLIGREPQLPEHLRPKQASPNPPADLPSPQPSPTQARLGELASLERPHSQANADGRGGNVAPVDRASPLQPHPLADAVTLSGELAKASSLGEGQGEGLSHWPVAQPRPRAE